MTASVTAGAINSLTLSKKNRLSIEKKGNDSLVRIKCGYNCILLDRIDRKREEIGIDRMV